MTEGEGVSYEALQEWLRAERRSNKLAPVPEGFWAKLQDFLSAIEDEFREAQARDPFDRRVMMLTDRIKNARHAAESLWTLRERKLAMLALAHVRDGDRPAGLTSKESVLYQGVLERLREGRRLVFEGTAAEGDYSGDVPRRKDRPPAPSGPATEAAQSAPETVPEEATADPADAGPADRAAPTVVTVPPDTPDADTVTIRALSDIPTFVGPDMQTYNLKEGDIASVPHGMADLLVKRGKVAVVDAQEAPPPAAGPS